MRRYKGYFAFAPVWVTDPDHSNGPVIEPRHIGHVLFPLALWLVQGINFLLSSTDPFYEPHFPVKIYENEWEEVKR